MKFLGSLIFSDRLFEGSKKRYGSFKRMLNNSALAAKTALLLKKKVSIVRAWSLLMPQIV